MRAWLRSLLWIASVGLVLPMLSGCGFLDGTFTLSATPGTVSIAPGGSGSITLTAVGTGGFERPVSVTLSGLPTGVTATPAVLTLKAGVPATVTLAAAANTTASTTTVTVHGTALLEATTTTFQVTVASPTPPDFSLSLSPSQLTLSAGGDGLPISVLVTAANGFSGSVEVAVAGLPDGVTAEPTMLTLSPGAAQKLTLTADATAQPTAATVTVAGTAGSLKHTADLQLSVEAAAPPPAATGPDVTTYHYDNTREGLNAAETILTPSNVNSSNFGLLHVFPVDGKVDAQPLYVGGLQVATGGAGVLENVLYVATEHDSVYALDAATGAQLWQATVLGAGETPSGDHGCNQITPEIGITATPVIDRKRGSHGAIFVVGMSKDAGGAFHQRLHALDLVTGAELPGSPMEITGSYPGTGESSTNGNVVFDPGQYAARAGLLLLNGNIYMGWTSHCDDQPYTGWVMGYSEATLQQSKVLNLTPNGSEGSIWMSGYGLAADTGGNMYLLDANGTLDTSFTPQGFPSGSDYGNAIVKLSTNGSLAVSDYFEPYNTVSESNADVDLGSGGAMLLPDLTDSTGTVRHLLVGAGKDGNIYVADRDHMGKFNQSANNNSNLYQELPGALPNGAWSGPAYFDNSVYYGGVNDPLRAFSVTKARLSTTPTSMSSTSFGYPGATPSVSANGTQDGIVWALESGTGSAAVLHAYDAADLGHELYNSTQAPGGRDSFGDGNKFLTPMVSNGRVYVGTPSGVAVFGLLPQ